MRWAGNWYRKRNCVIVSSTMITIHAQCLRHAPRGELLAEKGLNSVWNSCGESWIAHYFQSRTDFRGNQFTVHIVSYVEVGYEGFYRNIIIFLIYNITYLLKSRREHENKTHKYMFSWLFHRCENCGCQRPESETCRCTTHFLSPLSVIGQSPDSGIEFDRWTPAPGEWDSLQGSGGGSSRYNF